MSNQAMTQQIIEYFKTQPVVKVWLFGSFARGEENEMSDVDLLIQFDHSTPIGLFAYARMHRELEERLGCKVDLVEEGTLRPAIAAAAQKDMKMIYERVAQRYTKDLPVLLQQVEQYIQEIETKD